MTPIARARKAAPHVFRQRPLDTRPRLPPAIDHPPDGRRDLRRPRQPLVAGVPALLDTALAPQDLLGVSLEDYRHGRIAVGLITYELHPLVAASLERLGPHSRLFPWPWSMAIQAGRSVRSNELAEVLGVPPQLAIHHANRAVKFGLLTANRDGQRKTYAAKQT